MLKNMVRSILATITCLFALAVYAEPTDVSGHWANKEINRWIEGDPDGKFKPEDSMTYLTFRPGVGMR